MEGFNPSRTNLSTVSGPTSKPEFEIIASNVSGTLKRIADDGSLILSDGDAISSYTNDGQLRWRTNVRTSLNGPVVDIALASSGIVYVSSANRIIALDPQTGLSTWPQPVQTNSGDESGPLVVASDGTIYFHTGSTQPGSQEKLTAINPDGTRKWEYSGNTAHGSGRPVFNSDESTIYLQQLRAGSNAGGTVVGLSAATGRPTFDTPCDVRGGVYAYSGAKVLYTGDANNNLLEFPAGTQNCAVSTSGLAVADTAAVLNTLFVIQIPIPGTGTSYAAVDTEGRRIWSRIEPLIGGFADNGGEGSGTFFAIAPQTNEIVAIRIATGEELWRQQFRAPVSSVLLGGNGGLYAIVGNDLRSTAGAHVDRSHTNTTQPSPLSVRSNALRSADTAFISAATSTSGLVAAYSFNEGTGTTVADSSGNGNTGTISNAAWTTSGKYGNALVFNGTSSMVTINDSLSLHLTTGMTLEAWVKATAVSHASWVDVIYKQNDNYLLEASSTYGLEGPTAAGTFGSGFQGVAAPSVLAPNSWTHVAATIDGVNLTVWVNGVNVASQPQTSPLATSSMPLQIGGDSLYGQYFTGIIDEVRIYNRALSMNEIAADMNSPIGSSDTIPPTAPTNLSATASGGTQINLNWTASTDNVGVTGYQIERCRGTGCSSFTQVGTSTSASYSDMGLTPATSYSYRVRATDAAGNLSSYSNVASATTNAPPPPPTAPSNLTATASGATQINLSWTASTSANGPVTYLIERCPGGICGNFVQIGSSTTTTYTDSGLDSGFTYNYRVRASDTTNTLSGYSNITNATTVDIFPPTDPTHLTASAKSPTAIDLAWTPSADEPGELGGIGYQIERCQGAGCTNFALVLELWSLTLNSSSFTDTGLTPSTSYSYRIRALDQARNFSGYSNVATATTPGDTTPPTAPSNPVAFAGGAPASIIAWQEYNVGNQLTTHTTAPFDTTGGDLILVYAWTDMSVTTMSITDSKANTWISAAGPTSHPSAGVVLRTQLWYAKAANVGTGHTITMNLSTAGGLIMRVLVIKGSNTTGPIDATSAITDDGGIPTTNITSATITTSKPGDLLIDFAKTFNPGQRPNAAGAYTDYNSQAIGSEYAYGSVAGTYTASWTLVFAANWQNVLTSVISANASLSSTQITVTWTPSTDDVGVTGYLIERCAGAGCSNFAQIASAAATSSSYTDTSVSPGVTYSYRIRATDAAGNLSAYSSTVNASTTTDGLGTPMNLAAAASGGTQINLTWTASTGNVNGYQIERCQGAGCTSFALDGTSTSASYSDTGVAANTSYSYRVRATDAGGNLSGYSNIASASTDAGAPPTAPTNLTAAASGATQINLSWTASTSTIGILNYRIERCQGGICGNFVQIGTPTTTTYTDTGLASGITYTYRVRASDATNALSGYSNTATATTVDITPPTDPTNLTATAASSSDRAAIDLAWNPSTDETWQIGYRVERCQGAGCSNFVQIAELWPLTGGTSYHDTGLLPSTSYSYRIRALDQSGNLSGYSNVATATTAAPPNSGLVAAYSFNEGTGTTVADSSGNGNAGAIANAAWTTSGRYGNALVFDGTRSLVTVNDSPSLHLTTGMTLEAWVKPTAVLGASWVDVIYKQNDNYLLEASSTYGFEGPTAAGTFGSGFQGVPASSVLTPNTWTHVAATFDGANLTVWVNGVAVASQPQTSPLTTSSLPLQIGGDSLYGQYFTGIIDEVRIYNRALSTSEIAADMNSPIH